MFFSLACGGETPSGPSRAYAPGFRMRKDKSPNPSRTRLSRILAQPNPFFPPPAAEATQRAPRGRAPEDVCSTASPPPHFFIIKPFFFLLLLFNTLSNPGFPPCL